MLMFMMYCVWDVLLQKTLTEVHIIKFIGILAGLAAMVLVATTSQAKKIPFCIKQVINKIDF